MKLGIFFHFSVIKIGGFSFSCNFSIFMGYPNQVMLFRPPKTGCANKKRGLVL